MDCPHCKTTLLIADRQGVEIDHCPQCRGIWLDRGELDKIIERCNSFINDEARRFGYRRDDDDEEDARYRSRDSHRKSFWRELFD